MIYTVTLNPAIDKTIRLDRLEKGKLNYVQKTLNNPGGKGINVSFVLQALGMESIALGFAGGETGRQITEGLTRAQITNFFLQTGQETRTNIKITESDGTLTELNQKGARVSQELVETFVQMVEARIEADDILVLSGSVPAGVPTTIYRDLIVSAHQKGAKAILDADGELFSFGIEAGPDMIKPNYEEFLRYVNIEEPQEQQILSQMKDLFEKGISQIIISMGDQGAYFFDANEKEYIYCPSLPVEVKSTVGAGDSMVAAWVSAMERNYAFLKAVKSTMAVSAATVTTPGTMPPAIEKVHELEEKVTWEFRSI